MHNTPTSPTTKTILVIEDDTALLAAISSKLERSGFTVMTARSVETAFTSETTQTTPNHLTPITIAAALAHLETLKKIDAIWLDHNLIGEEDGLDFIVKFKANGGIWSTLPIFVVSNSANPELIKTYSELDVHHYYLKAEHRLEDIIAEITTVLGGGETASSVTTI